ncbi:MAG: hypothetical protein ABL952_17235, partial [Pyrinomonadaceae bacterium]
TYVRAIGVHSDMVKKFVAFYPNLPELPGIVLDASQGQRSLAIEIYNRAVSTKDVAARNEAFRIASSGFVQADEFAKRAVELTFAADINPKLANEKTKAEYHSALINRVDTVSLVARYVEHTVSDDTHQIFLQYLAVQKDAKKKQLVWLSLAKLYSDTGSDPEKAGLIYAMILKDSPDNLEALYSGGVVLVALASKPGMVTGAEYLKRFLTLAPSSDIRRKDAQEMLEYLKKLHGITP